MKVSQFSKIVILLPPPRKSEQHNVFHGKLHEALLESVDLKPYYMKSYRCKSLYGENFTVSKASLLYHDGIHLGGKWLTSDIINAAMTVLQQQFPFSGFQSVMKVPVFSGGAWYYGLHMISNPVNRTSTFCPNFLLSGTLYCCMSEGR